jgi:dCTP deaminase
MTDDQIRKALEAGNLGIDGFDSSSLQATSYDAHIGREVRVSHATETTVLGDQRQTIALQPGEFALVVTNERFRLPMDVAANIGPKTYFTLKGLILLAGMQIDPGFEGALRLGVYNASPKAFVLEYRQPICTVQFFRLSQAATRRIQPDPDLVAGRLPRVDKDYFRELETQSLSQVAQELKHLTRSVAQLTENVDTLGKKFGEWQVRAEKIMWRVVTPLVVALIAALVTAIAK